MEKEARLWLVKVKATENKIGQNFIDVVSRVLRSWFFIIGQALFIGAWITVKHLAPHYNLDDDNFNLLKLILTIEASFALSILLKCHYRHTEINRKIMYNNYLLDYQMKNQLKELKPLIKEIHERGDILS